MSSSLLSKSMSRERATLAARSASTLHDASIEEVERLKILDHHVTSSSGREFIQRASLSFRSKESRRTYRSPRTSSSGSNRLAARTNNSRIRKISSGSPASEITRT